MKALLIAAIVFATPALADGYSCGKLFKHADLTAEDVRIIELAELHVELLKMAEGDTSRPVVAAEFKRKFTELQKVIGKDLKERMLRAAEARAAQIEHDKRAEEDRKKEEDRKRQEDQDKLQVVKDVVRVPKSELDSINSGHSGSGDAPMEPNGVFWSMNERYLVLVNEKNKTTRIFDTQEKRYLPHSFEHGMPAKDEPLLIMNKSGKAKVVNFITGQELGTFDGDMATDERSVTSKAVLTVKRDGFTNHYTLHQPGTGKSLYINDRIAITDDLSRVAYFDEARNKAVFFDTATWTEINTVDATRVDRPSSPFGHPLQIRRDKNKSEFLPLAVGQNGFELDHDGNPHYSEDGNHIAYTPPGLTFNNKYIRVHTSNPPRDIAYPDYSGIHFLAGGKYAVLEGKKQGILDLATGKVIADVPGRYGQRTEDGRFLYRYETVNSMPDAYTWSFYEVATGKTFSFGPPTSDHARFLSSGYFVAERWETSEWHLGSLDDIANGGTFQPGYVVGHEQVFTSPSGRFFATEDGDAFAIRKAPK